jgi:hypothetical protein
MFPTCASTQFKAKFDPSKNQQPGSTKRREHTSSYACALSEAGAA